MTKTSYWYTAKGFSRSASERPKTVPPEHCADTRRQAYDAFRQRQKGAIRKLKRQIARINSTLETAEDDFNHYD